jgi:Kelch motif
MLVLALTGLADTGSASPPVPGWSVTSAQPMSAARAAHQASVLRGGKLILLSGGCSGSGCTPIERSAELIDVESGRSQKVGEMSVARVAHMAAPLDGRRILVVGGWNGAAATNSAEMFDLDALRFSAIGKMAFARMDGTATPLVNGSVLVVGGARASNQPIARVELFDATVGSFATVGDLREARAHHAAVRLLDGRVLVVGGLRSRGVATHTAEIYNPYTKTFEITGSMQQARCKHAAVLLPDGRVMVIGGSPSCSEEDRVAQTEIYDPKKGRFEAGPSLLNPRYKIVSAAVPLANGAVIVAGDANDVEMWVPGALSFEKIAGPIGSRLAFSAATALPSGDVLLTGGYDDSIRSTTKTWLIQRRSLKLAAGASPLNGNPQRQNVALLAKTSARTPLQS